MQDMDLIVHQTLIESQEWTEAVVCRKASVLAKAFLEALEPLFAPHLQDQNRGSKMLSGTCLDNEDYLKGVFEDALSLHGRSLISMSSFQAIMYTPGTLFDEKTMESRSAGSMDLKKHRVKLCMQPALFCYDGTREVVDYKVFVPPGSDPTRDYMVVQKAVVMLEDNSWPQSYVGDSEEECSSE